MKRKTSKALLAVVLAFFLTGAAGAVALFPTTLEMTVPTDGVIHQGDSFTMRATTEKFGNIVEDEWTFLGDDYAGTRVIADIPDDPEDPDGPSTEYYRNTKTFTVPGDLAPGTYTVYYTIYMANKAPGQPGYRYYENDEEYDIRVLAFVIEVDECPAAPAIAANILKDAGISHRFDTGENREKGKGKPIFGNYINEVARAMGKGASFPAYDEDGDWDGETYIEKCDAEDYYDAVLNFLIELGADL